MVAGPKTRPINIVGSLSKIVRVNHRNPQPNSRNPPEVGTKEKSRLLDLIGFTSPPSRTIFSVSGIKALTG